MAKYPRRPTVAMLQNNVACMEREVKELHEYICTQNRRISDLERLREMWQDVHSHKDRIGNLQAQVDNLRSAIREMHHESLNKQQRSYFRNLWAALRNKR